MAKETYRLNGMELTSLINEEVERALSENQTDEKWTYNDMFGIKTRRENRVNAIKYARLYGSYVNKIQKISDEVSRRLEILQNSQRLNEVAGALARIGAKFAAKGITKAGAKAFSKSAGKVVGKIGLASIPAFIVGPENIQGFFQKFNSNRAQATPQEVIAAYDELATWMGNICSVLQQHPEIIGAVALQDATLNGPEQVESGPMFDAADATEMAVGIGVLFIPYVGWALGAIDLAHTLVHAGAEANQEGLKAVAKQIEYLDKAIADVNAALTKASDPRAAQQAQARQGQPQANPQVQAQTQEPQAPQGYVIGQPAPFATNDPEQVKRMQSYFGLQPTGKWDNNTQSAWDRWLGKRYPSLIKNVGKNVGRAVVGLTR